MAFSVHTAVYLDSFDELLRLGNGIAGTPQTVCNTQVRYAGINYVACQLFFGDMSVEEALRSTHLLAEQTIANSDASAEVDLEA